MSVVSASYRPGNDLGIIGLLNKGLSVPVLIEINKYLEHDIVLSFFRYKYVFSTLAIFD